MINVASIVTRGFVERALTMFESMYQYRDDCHLDLLVINRNKEDTMINLKNVTLHHVSEFYDHPEYGNIYRLIIANHSRVVKNRPKLISHNDYLRWSLKPVFVNILLEKYDRVFFCDHDLFFYNNYDFLDEWSADRAICLSPHWRTIYPTVEMEWEYNFKHGLYNGGFFIATRLGRPILDWWSEMCVHKCTANESDATYVDQKYLDVVPLYYDNVGIIKHKGCNVAAWNRTYLKRGIKDGQTVVNGYPIIFIHYSPVTIKHISDNIDPLLQQHYREYQDALLDTRTELMRNDLTHFTTGSVATGKDLI